jgi:hypothetical protein
VILSWTASAAADSTHAAAIGYCVYRGISADDPSPVQINSVVFSGTSCMDDKVRNGAKYFYLVQAISAKSVPSKSSNVATAKIPAQAQSNLPGSSVPLCRGISHELN